MSNFSKLFCIMAIFVGLGFFFGGVNTSNNNGSALYNPISLIIGFLIFLHGFLPLSKCYIKRKKQNEAKQIGTKIKATIKSIKKNYYDDRIKKPYRLTLEHIDQNNKKHSFISDNIESGYEINKYIKIGDILEVYIESNNYAKYYVDVISQLNEIKNKRNLPIDTYKEKTLIEFIGRPLKIILITILCGIVGIIIIFFIIFIGGFMS